MIRLHATIADARGKRFRLAHGKGTRPRRFLCTWTELRASLPSVWINLAHMQALMPLAMVYTAGLCTAHVVVVTLLIRRAARSLPGTPASTTLDAAFLFWSASPALVVVAAAIILRAFKRCIHRRAIMAGLRARRCPSCWYDLAGASGASGEITCPECGAHWRQITDIRWRTSAEST